MFGRKKEAKLKVSFDPGTQYPAVRCSICTGEKVAGLKSRQDGSFEELMLIRGGGDLAAFRSCLGLGEDAEIEEFY